MPRTKKDANFNGTIGNLKDLKESLSTITKEYQLSEEDTIKILLESIDKAYRETNYETHNKYTIKSKDENGNEISIVRPSDANAMHSETIIDKETGKIIFYECKDVINDDDIEDDLYQISPEEASEKDPSKKYVVGDIYKEAHTLENQDLAFFNRVKILFLNRVKETVKKALVDKYQDRVGQIVSAVVESVDTNKDGKVYVTINNIPAVLEPRQQIPGEIFTPGSVIKVLLKRIGENNSKDKENKGPSLIISRTDPLFLRRLFEQEIPDIADGSVKIENIAREPGVRAKVAVSSKDPNIDPSGACIGTDGSRIKDICMEISNEKIDIIRYNANKYLYIAEALKPATVIGVVLKDNEAVPEGKKPKAIAVVKNEESKVAIGKFGVNVRLASILTDYSIDVKEIDEAIRNQIAYSNIDEIKRKEALDRLDLEAQSIIDSQDLSNDIDLDNTNEPNEEDDKAADEYIKNNTIEDETASNNKVEQTNEVASNDNLTNLETTTEETNSEETPIEANQEEHVEITNKAKISISELEAQIEEEKKKKNSEPSYKKYKKEDKKKEEKEDSKKKIINAMPIYTEEELKQIDEEEQEEEYEDEEDFSEYDDDHYYDDGK